MKKILVMGFGFMGQTHTRTILNNKNTQLVGIIDSVPPSERLGLKGNINTATVALENIKDIPHFTTLEEAFEKANPDAIVIALPTYLHYENVMKSLNYNLDVFVEKPFALKNSECEEMIKLAEEKNRKLAVGYVLRSSNEYRIVKEYIDNNTFGKLKFLSLKRFTGVPSWGDWKKSDTVKKTGGALFDLVSHDIDIACCYFNKIDSVQLNKTICNEFDGNMISVILQRNGVNIQIEGGFVTPSSAPFRREFQAYFENGTIQSFENGSIQIIDKDGIEIKNFQDNPYEFEINNFIDAIVDNKELVCSAKEATKTVYICNEILEKKGK